MRSDQRTSFDGLGTLLDMTASAPRARFHRLGQEASQRSSACCCGPLALVALFRPRLDLRARLRELGQTLLAQGQLLGNRQAVGDVGLVLRLGARLARDGRAEDGNARPRRHEDPRQLQPSQREARAKIEARAKERYERERAEHEAKLAERQAKTAATGKKPGGKPPAPPVEGPLPKDQINLTDEDDRSSTMTSFSVAKSFVSALIGVAIADGKIELDDPIIRYLPELADRPGLNEIRVRHLLAMASGLHYSGTGSGGGPFGDDARNYYDPDLRALALTVKAEVRPGTRWQYNNFHPLLLGLILERVTGESVSAYRSDKIWQRLGMEAPGSWSLDSRHEGFEKIESGLAEARSSGSRLPPYRIAGTPMAWSPRLSSRSSAGKRNLPLPTKDDERGVTTADGRAA